MNFRTEVSALGPFTLLWLTTYHISSLFISMKEKNNNCVYLSYDTRE